MSHKAQYTPEIHEHADEWHHHTSAEGLPQAEHGAKPNTVLLFIAFIGSLFFVGVTILATYLYFNTYTATVRAERSENTALGEDYRVYRDTSHKALHDGYVWLNDNAARAGHVTLPLNTARDRVLARYQR